MARTVITSRAERWDSRVFSYSNYPHLQNWRFAYASSNCQRHVSEAINLDRSRLSAGQTTKNDGLPHGRKWPIGQTTVADAGPVRNPPALDHAVRRHHGKRDRPWSGGRRTRPGRMLPCTRPSFLRRPSQVLLHRRLPDPWTPHPGTTRDRF